MSLTLSCLRHRCAGQGRCTAAAIGPRGEGASGSGGVVRPAEGVSDYWRPCHNGASLGRPYRFVPRLGKIHLFVVRLL
eukprot:1189056-Prorocentrum_minimum.AAC.1